MSPPSRATAGSRQLLARRPSTRTVQAPHWPWSQPFLAPMRSRSSRSTSRSTERWSTVSVCGLSFTRRVTSEWYRSRRAEVPRAGSSCMEDLRWMWVQAGGRGVRGGKSAALRGYVVVLVRDSMDGRLFRGGRATVDAHIAGEQAALGVLVCALVRGNQPARPVRPHLAVQWLTGPACEVPRGVVRARLFQRRIRKLLSQPLVQALAL